MRLSNFFFLAVPLVATAAQQGSSLDQVKAQAQYWLDKLASFTSTPPKVSTYQDAAPKIAARTLKILTLRDWEQTIRSSVKELSTRPEEWWVLVTGGNKTCFGQCHEIENAFNQTASLWSFDESAPNMAYLDCDAQPVLCNSWAAGPPSLWIIEVAAPPALTDIHTHGLNLTNTTVKTFADLHESKEWKQKAPYESYFHPFDGPLAKYGLAVPLGYVLWFLAIVPSWVFMIGVSFLSRAIMGRRAMGPQAQRPVTTATPSAPR